MKFLLPFDGERRLAMSGSRILAASPTTMSSTATTSWWTEARKISCGCWARYVECTESSICIPKRWWLLLWANEWKQRATRSLKTWTGTRIRCLPSRLGVKSADLNNELKWIKLNEQSKGGTWRLFCLDCTQHENWTKWPGNAVNMGLWRSAVPESSSRFPLATRYFSPEGGFATELKLKLWMFHEHPEMFQGLVEPSSKSVEMDVSSAALKVSRQDSTINFIFVRSTAPCTTRTSYSARHSLSLSQICWHESHGHLSVDSPHNGMTKTNILNLYWAYLFNSINLSLY